VVTTAHVVQSGVPAGRRFYEIAGITLQVEADLPMTDATFESKFAAFAADGPGDDVIVVRHHFGLEELDLGDLGCEVYRRRPWTIYRSPDRFIYVMGGPGDELDCIAYATVDHAVVDVYHGARREAYFRAGDVSSLTLLPTDQIVLARALAERRACFLHSCGVIVDGLGLLFVGHSGAGKSTMMTMLAEQGEPLCDDRNIVRVWSDAVRVHGCWSHGEVPIVSAASAPLGALLFLRKASANRVVRLRASGDILSQVLPCVIKPLVTADWWERTLDVIEHVVDDVPCYIVEFDKSGAVVTLIRDLVTERVAALPQADAGAAR